MGNWVHAQKWTLKVLQESLYYTGHHKHDYLQHEAEYT